MQDITTIDLRKMLEETGHELCLDDIEPIIELDELAEAVVKGDTVPDESLLSRPTFIHDLAFYPPTLARSLYWQNVISTLFEDGTLLATAALVWLCNRPAVNDEMIGASPKDLRKKIHAFAKTSLLTNDDIEEVRELYRDKGTSATKKTKNKYGDLVAFLRREYGQDADYWMNADSEEIRSCLADYNRKLEAEMSASRKSGSGGAVAKPASPLFVFHRRYRKAKEALKAKWTEG
jgi:hypothetical protein